MPSGMITVGTSGWQYDDWRHRFYPDDLATSEWLPYFAERFPSVEVNNSFYRLPTEETFARWEQQAPPGFVFAVKASRFITHLKRLKDPGEPVALLWERMRPLGDKRGPVLFQLPPRFKPDPSRLQAVLDAIPRGMRTAFEFRDARWETDEVFAMLDTAGAAFVYADKPRARVPDIQTGGWSYIRFHQGRLVAPGYERSKLERWADRIATLRGEIYVYFNNDTDGAALRDAVTLSELLRERERAVSGPTRGFAPRGTRQAWPAHRGRRSA